MMIGVAVVGCLDGAEVWTMKGLTTHPEGAPVMRLPRVQVRLRSLLIAVILIALLLTVLIQVLDNIRRFNAAYFPAKTGKTRI
jgi:hypothetical protein